MLNENLQNFLNNTKQPWFIESYKMFWGQLADISNLTNLKILDFGSGFGITANYMAENNKVIAIEPNADMAEERVRENNYTQFIGSIEKLKDFADGYFDVVICHNVLEYASERAEIVKEFSRILKTDGILSIVKHNKTGRIMHEVVFANNTDEALSILDGGERLPNAAFGRIDYYNPEDLVAWGDNLKIEKILGVRMFFALQQKNEIKYEPGWLEKMFEVEMRVCDLEPYKNIAYLNHVLLRKI
ncbi:MAG: methyltransferase domain-containing protein [Oscillospiraceae bacterium]|nr:methyltransferase domain-containing protein [Oscillospiraceae bacterium]